MEDRILTQREMMEREGTLPRRDGSEPTRRRFNLESINDIFRSTVAPAMEQIFNRPNYFAPRPEPNATYRSLSNTVFNAGPPTPPSANALQGFMVQVQQIDRDRIRQERQRMAEQLSRVTAELQGQINANVDEDLVYMQLPGGGWRRQ